MKFPPIQFGNLDKLQDVIRAGEAQSVESRKVAELEQKRLEAEQKRLDAERHKAEAQALLNTVWFTLRVAGQDCVVDGRTVLQMFRQAVLDDFNYREGGDVGKAAFKKYFTAEPILELAWLPRRNWLGGGTKAHSDRKLARINGKPAKVNGIIQSQLGKAIYEFHKLGLLEYNKTLLTSAHDRNTWTLTQAGRELLEETPESTAQGDSYIFQKR